MGKGFLKQNGCAACNEALFKKDTSVMTGPEQAFSAFKAYAPTVQDMFSGLQICSDEYFTFIKHCNDKFKDIFAQHCNQRNVGQVVFNDYVCTVLPNLSFQLCSKQALDTLLRFFIRCKIHFAVRMHNNRSGRKLTITKSKLKKCLKSKKHVKKPVKRVN